MPDRYRAPGGWRVQIVHLENTPDRRDGEWLRVTLHGSWVANVRTPADLERYFRLSELVEGDDGLSTAA
jgi:hypothetical protein